MTYEEALEYILSLAPRGWKLGLERMEEFAKRAGLSGSLGDGATPKFIHVAGTNGKGSTTALLQSMLVEQGYRTGSFFSPYVVDPRERVQFNRELIAKEDMVAITQYLMEIGDSLTDTEFGGVSEFEFKTAIGFEMWKRKQCEWVALEVGLGGRLDATNIITPEVSVIVSIGYDHTNLLGTTLAEIAGEKAGIIKQGKPVIVGRMAPEALSVIEMQAKNLDCVLWRMDQEIQIESKGNSVIVRTPLSEVQLTPSLFGEIQHHNAALAFAALEIAGGIDDVEAVQRGASSAYIPGRFQNVDFGGRKFILDGAHNQDSAVVLSSLLTEAGIHKCCCITGMLTGHEPEDFYPMLSKHVEEYLVVPIDFHRSRNPHDVVRMILELGYKATAFDSIKAAISWVTGESETDAACHDRGVNEVLVTGSFYLVGETLRLLN